MEGTSLGVQSIHSFVSQVPFEGFSLNVTPRTFCACAAYSVSVRWVKYQRGFIWRTMISVCPISYHRIHFSEPSHNALYLPILCKGRTFGFDPSIMRGTLLGEQISVFVPILMDFPQIAYVAVRTYALYLENTITFHL